MMRSNRLLAIILLIVLAGCESKYQKINITDITKNSKLILETENKDPIRIYMRFYGEVDGTASITIVDDYSYKKTYKLERGKVEYNIDCDWYNQKCIIIYSPENVVNGELHVEYKFY